MSSFNFVLKPGVTVEVARGALGYVQQRRMAKITRSAASGSPLGAAINLSVMDGSPTGTDVIEFLESEFPQLKE